MNRWSFSPSPPWTRLLIRNPAKQVRPAAPFLPVFSSWSTRSSAPGFPPGHRLIRGLTRDTRGIYSAERRREDGNRERWETARISPPGCGEAGVYFPPPTACKPPLSLCLSLAARSRTTATSRWRKVSLRSAQLHLLRAGTLLRAAFNVLTANGLPSRAVS